MPPFTAQVSWTPQGIQARITYQTDHAMNPNEFGLFSGALNSAMLTWASTTMQSIQPPNPSSAAQIVQYNFNGNPRAWSVTWTVTPLNWVAYEGVTLRVINVKQSDTPILATIPMRRADWRGA